MVDGSTHNLSQGLWQICVDHLAQELPEQQFNTWIRPLAAEVAEDLSKVKRARTHGFLTRMKTRGGRAVIAARRAKGRKRLAV